FGVPVLEALHELRGQDGRIKFGGILFHALIPGSSVKCPFEWPLAPNKGIAASSERSLNSSMSDLSKPCFCGSKRNIASIATVWFAKRIGTNACTLARPPERSRAASSTWHSPPITSSRPASPKASSRSYFSGSIPKDQKTCKVAVV